MSDNPIKLKFKDPFAEDDDQYEMVSPPPTTACATPRTNVHRGPPSPSLSGLSMVVHPPHRHQEADRQAEIAKITKKLDEKLEKLVLEEEPTPVDEPAEAISTEIPSPSTKAQLFQFQCAFGFKGDLDEPTTIPKTKIAFLNAIRAEISGIGFIQKGLHAYMCEINSRKYHVFSTQFLIHQNTATVITCDQLDQIHKHLQEVVKEVQEIEGDEAVVKDELIEAFRHAQPWVQRTRRILVESHVFYKINYVLGADKK